MILAHIVITCRSKLTILEEGVMFETHLVKIVQLSNPSLWAHVTSIPSWRATVTMDKMQMR